MGSMLSCFKGKKEYEAHLIRDIVCDQCHIRFYQIMNTINISLFVDVYMVTFNFLYSMNIND